METTTPLWLDLKKEYIDDNFEKLLVYLRDIGTKKDAFYEQTIELLRARTLLLIDELAHRTLSEDEEKTDSRIFNIRLLAAWLLADTEGKDCHKAFIAMLGELRMEVSKYSDDLLLLATESLCYERVKEGGFSWEDVIDFKKEIFCFKVINNHKFIVPRMKERYWKGYGTVVATKERLYILPTAEEKKQKVLEETTVGIDTAYGIRVTAAGKEKLKQSQMSDIRAIDTFTKNFNAELKRTGIPKYTVKQLHNYCDKDDVNVRITGITGETIFVETTDPAYNKLQGQLVFPMKSLLYYYNSMFAKWFEKGYLLQAQVKSAAKQTFTIEKTFVDFIVDDFSQNDMDEEVLATLIDNSREDYVWLTDMGTPIYAHKDEDYSKGDFAYIRATEICEGRQRGKIVGEITGRANDSFDESKARKECLLQFCLDPDSAADRQPQEEPAEGLDSLVLMLLIRHLFAHQKNLMKPTERLRLLAVARILSEMLSDVSASEYIDFAASYLRALVYFAKDEDVRQVSITIPEDCQESTSALFRASVVQLLKQWGKDGDENVLVETMQTFGTILPSVARIARIIQTSNSMQEIVTDASINVLKREVIKTLQLETDDQSDLESEKGIYLGVESGSMEFKESIVFPPDNGMEANEGKQLRNVLRGICAFLNSPTGGTLYLGVSDSGYVKGIQRDLEYLNITSPDTYMRLHIQDPAKKLLGLDVITHLHLELLYDEQVVAIHVDPYPYRIVELEGKAYLRINAESREMNDSVKQQLLNKKVFTDQEKAANLARIQQGMLQQQVVILHQYASSNSGTFSDRTVEAYNVFPESNIVVCYEIKSNTCKCFNLKRIGYVEITDTAWSHKQSHKSIKVDAFHLSGEKKIHCTLELDLFARNLLIEEFPLAKDDLRKSGDSNQWILDTDVYQIEGIARFYIGLANHIRILECPELIDYVKQFVNENLTQG